MYSVAKVIIIKYQKTYFVCFAAASRNNALDETVQSVMVPSYAAVLAGRLRSERCKTRTLLIAAWADPFYLSFLVKRVTLGNLYCWKLFH